MHVKQRNDEALAEGYPVVKTAPLPAGAQFLNVIESVFSGMARAIIHNSDYGSVEAAKDAIDRYYAERNEYFRAHPIIREQGTRSGDKSGSEVNFTRVIIAKIPFIVGEWRQSDRVIPGLDWQRR